MHDLATVLAQNPDINVMVEGHTDDVRLTGPTANCATTSTWVPSATTVVRLLLENKGNHSRAASSPPDAASRCR